MTRREYQAPEALIVRSGYETEEQWKTAIRTALIFGRSGWVIDDGGRRTHLSLWKEP